MRKKRYLTEEHKRKIRATSKRIWNCDELKKKMSIIKTGKPIPKLQGRVSPFKGKKHTPEAKEKNRQAKLSNPTKHWLGKKRWLRPEDNPGWLGGRSFEAYSINWTTTLKRSIRERDFYTCQVCKEPQGEEALSVHHIDYNKKNCNPRNLVSLCRACHARTNRNRKYWQNYFKPV